VHLSSVGPSASEGVARRQLVLWVHGRALYRDVVDGVMGCVDAYRQSQDRERGMNLYTHWQHGAFMNTDSGGVHRE
jgi:hypothetical protein